MKKLILSFVFTNILFCVAYANTPENLTVEGDFSQKKVEALESRITELEKEQIKLASKEENQKVLISAVEKNIEAKLSANKDIVDAGKAHIDSVLIAIGVLVAIIAVVVASMAYVIWRNFNIAEKEMKKAHEDYLEAVKQYENSRQKILDSTKALNACKTQAEELISSAEVKFKEYEEKLNKLAHSSEDRINNLADSVMQKIEEKANIERQANSLMAESQSLFNKKEYTTAMEKIERAISLLPKNSYFIQAKAALGLEWYRKEYPQDIEILKTAEKDITKAIAQTPQNAEYYNIRGNIYTLLNEIEKAVIDYKKALELAPSDTGIKLNYIELLILTNKISEANKVSDTIGELKNKKYSVVFKMLEAYKEAIASPESSEKYEILLSSMNVDYRNKILEWSVFEVSNIIQQYNEAQKKALQRVIDLIENHNKNVEESLKNRLKVSIENRGSLKE